MEKEKLAQRVKDLRKRQGLSQDDLAKESGLSLRTIQRVENGETEPTGETLKRISSGLDVTPNELICRDSDKVLPKKTVKTKYEYLQIFENRLVISKTETINDLLEDYGKSVNNVFKTLMVFFIGIPIFTTLTVIFYNMGKTGLAINAGAFAFMFLVVAFYSILFTSGSSIIKMENVSKIMIKKTFNFTTVVILHRESGRLKERNLILEKDQIEIMKDSLLLENLIDENSIKLKTSLFSLPNIMLTLPMLIFFFVMVFNKADQMMLYYAVIILFGSATLIFKMILRSISRMGKRQLTANNVYTK